MGIRRPGTKGYEEVEGVNLSTGPTSPNINGNGILNSPEFELASVSVVPDGSLWLINPPHLHLLIFLDFSDTFTVAQAVNALGFGWFQVKLSLFVGLCWMSDSMEMTILSVLGPALHCDWGISRYQQAMVTTVVFLGMMLSSTFWGSLSDKYGRKPVSSLKTWPVQWTQFWSLLGFDTLRHFAVLVWTFECSLAQLRMASPASWISRLCDRCRPSKCHPLRRVSTHQTTSQMRRVTWLLLGTWSLLWSGACNGSCA